MPDSPTRLAAFAIALHPVVWIGLLILRTAQEQMTWHAMRLAFASGCLATAVLMIGVPFAHGPLQEADLAQALKIAFLFAALPEEGVRLLLLLTIVSRHEDIREPRDLILAGALLGLGFAAVENLFSVFSRIDGQAWFAVGLGRACTIVPFHASNGLLMAAILTRAGETRTSRAGWTALAFFVPLLFHGSYDVIALPLKHLVNQGKPGLEWVAGISLAVILGSNFWLGVLVGRRSLIAAQENDSAVPAPIAGARLSKPLRRILQGTVWLTVLLCILLAGVGIAVPVLVRPAEVMFMGSSLVWAGWAILPRILRPAPKESRLLFI